MSILAQGMLYEERLAKPQPVVTPHITYMKGFKPGTTLLLYYSSRPNISLSRSVLTLFKDSLLDGLVVHIKESVPVFNSLVRHNLPTVIN